MGAFDRETVSSSTRRSGSIELADIRSRCPYLPAKDIGRRHYRGMTLSGTVRRELGPQLISTSAAARALGISERHLRGLTERGRLRIVRLGRRVLVPIAEVERLVAEGSR